MHNHVFQRGTCKNVQWGLICVFNEVFPTVIVKRSPAERFSNDCLSVMLNDRSVLGLSMGKVCVQGHPVTGGFELDQQK